MRDASTLRVGARYALLAVVSLIAFGCGKQGSTANSSEIISASASPVDSAATACDLARFTQAESRFLRLVAMNATAPLLGADLELRGSAARFIAESEKCYTSVSEMSASLDPDDPLHPIDDGGLWASSELAANYAFIGTKWGAGTMFSAPPALPGGTVTYSYMGDGVGIGPHVGYGAEGNVSIQSLPTYASCFLTDIANAFAAWSAVANIQFVQVPDSGAAFDAPGAQADIRIGAHSFDSPGNVLGHAYYPPPNGPSAAGDIHFDTQDTWSCDTTGIDIGIVGLHEIGHSIGLSHESDVLAVMNPVYNRNLPILQADDSAGAAAIYGPAPLVTFAITGNAGAAGARLAYDDGGPKTAIADAAGNYSFSVPAGWSGTAELSRKYFTFTPGSTPYTNVTTDLSSQDYVAKPDLFVYRAGSWLAYDFSSGAYLPSNSKWTGNPGGACVPAPMDTDGDAVVEFTQLCGGAWYFYNEDGSFNESIWVGNQAGQKPVPADYDGDGTDDVVVFVNGAWNRYSLTTGSFVGGVWTGSPAGNAIPVPMDYDGNGSAEPTILSGGSWHFYNANGSYSKGIWVGNIANQLPVPGDYNGDGTDDVWVYRAGAWLPYNFTTGAYLPAQAVWTGNPARPAGGGATEPAPLDYDGDGELDFTVFAGGPWHFFNDNGSYLKGIWVGKNVVDVPISRRLLP